MMIETIADREYADAVKVIARSIRKKEQEKQFVTESYKLALDKTLEHIIASGGHIDQIKEFDNNWLIVYTASDEIK